MASKKFRIEEKIDRDLAYQDQEETSDEFLYSDGADSSLSEDVSFGDSFSDIHYNSVCHSDDDCYSEDEEKIPSKCCKPVKPSQNITDEEEPETSSSLSAEEKRRNHLTNTFQKNIEKNIDKYEQLSTQLKWVDSYVEPVPKSIILNKSRPVLPPQKKERVKGRFNNAKPLKIDIRIGNDADITFKPSPVTVNNATKIDKQQPVKSKKIWMCKNIKKFGNCRNSTTCPYAHSEKDVEIAVSKCTFNVCKLIKCNGKLYENIGGERKCFKLHKNESIANFISRTSN